MQTSSTGSSRTAAILFGVLSISFCTLAFEIYLLRLFSIREWYHFASMIVSVALFGFSLSGTVLAILPRPAPGSLPGLGVLGCAGFAAASCLAVWGGNAFQFEPIWATFGAGEGTTLLAWYLLSGAPFFFSGLVVGAALAALPQRAGSVYGASLLGSGGGCAAALLLVPTLRESTPGLLGGIALLGAVGFAGSGGWEGRLRWPLLLAALALPLLPLPPPAVSTYKALSRFRTFKGTEVLSTLWDPASQVDVVRSDQIRFAPGRSLHGKVPLPPQVGILVDGDSLTAVTEVAGEIPSFPDELPSSIAYRLRKGGDALILQAGGGLSVITAVRGGMSRVVAQESNPLVARVASEDLAAFGGGLFGWDGVELRVEDARGLLRREEASFDVVEVSLREGIYASTAGLSGLGEDYLFTVEAFGRIRDRLREGGLLQLTRWLSVPPREEVRLFATALEAWERRGETRPADSLVVFQSISTLTLLARKGPFPGEELERIRGFLDELGFDAVYLPGRDSVIPPRHFRSERAWSAEVLHGLATAPDRDAFFESYPFHVRPATDSRPFYRRYLRWGRLRELREETGMRWEPLFEAAILYGVVLVIAAGLSLVCLILPVLLVHIRRRGEGAPRVATYFFLIGLGFMFVEIPAIQGSILTLGEPAYSFSAVVGSVLLFSGVGSTLSGRPAWRRREKWIFLSLVALILLGALLGPLWRDRLGGPLILRLFGVVIALAPMAFLMGFPFPQGIRALRGEQAGLVPWAWAANGAASVVGAVLATLLATAIGFPGVMTLGAALYLLALGVSGTHD